MDMQSPPRDNNNNTNSSLSSLFAVDERVLASDGRSLESSTDHPETPVYYKAIVRACQLSQSQKWKYKIHYLGWKARRWDCWVDADMIRPEALRHQLCVMPIGPDPEEEEEENYNNHNHNTKRKAGDETVATTTTTSVYPRLKRKKSHHAAASSSKVPSNATAVALVYQDACELPLTLQTILVDEMEKITRTCRSHSASRLVHVLPAPVTVQHVLDHWVHKKNKANLQPTARLLQELFQSALPQCLLYPQERPQWELLQQTTTTTQPVWTKVYGCEYLLRLYVRLPYLLQPPLGTAFETGEPWKNPSTLAPLLADLLQLVQKNKAALFKGTYRNPNPDEYLPEERLEAAASPSSKTTKVA